MIVARFIFLLTMGYLLATAANASWLLLQHRVWLP